jgi:hypothetical protein
VKFARLVVLAMIACTLLGCAELVGPQPAPTPKPVELPIANLPRSLREWNWGGGSCVHASTVMHFRWHGAMELADFWRKTYAGGESYNGLTSKLNRNKIPFYSISGGGGQDVAGEFVSFMDQHNLAWYGTFNGAEDVLERCTKERRGGVIFYYPNHSIWFCGFTPDRTQAIVLDNNRIDSFIAIPKDKFLREWRGYGGVCIVPQIGEPRPPLPYIAQR